jgi:hypothetical protein
MPAEIRYIVREAVLVKADHGSAWSVHFVPQKDSSDEREGITVLISPTDIDEMLFATPYTLEEIRALEDGRRGGDASLSSP